MPPGLFRRSRVHERLPLPPSLGRARCVPLDVLAVEQLHDQLLQPLCHGGVRLPARRSGKLRSALRERELPSVVLRAVLVRFLRGRADGVWARHDSLHMPRPPRGSVPPARFGTLPLVVDESLPVDRIRHPPAFAAGLPRAIPAAITSITSSFARCRTDRPRRCSRGRSTPRAACSPLRRPDSRRTPARLRGTCGWPL